MMMFIKCPYNITFFKSKHFSKFITQQLYRNKSSLGLWDEELSTKFKLKIEQHWKQEVICETAKSNSSKMLYILPMFPYPSGNLHMGHVRVYSISDTMARFYKLSGYNVIHPMGWDSFGLPAENAAIERNTPPDLWTQSNICSMKNQLKDLAFNFDWDREISTCDPDYYKWTQYIFLKLFEKNLAYQDKAAVNWDPVDQTVLADEQVDEQGCSWRSGAKVEKKILKQWFVKTTQLAEQLYNGLDSKELENWNDIINLQKHWIGNCDGTVVTFKVDNRTIDIWSSKPYKFIYGQFLTIKKDNILLTVNNSSNDRIPNQSKLCTINPITGLELPIYVAEHDLYPEGRDIYLCSPATDLEDRKLANSLDIKVIEKETNLDLERDTKVAISIAKEKDVGGYNVSSKLKDWLISRQRYWGTPIPIIHCNGCGAVPVPYDQIPVKLPEVKNNLSGIQTLKSLGDWIKCKCPKCNMDAKRETDTMDTFVDSSWYFNRFLDPKNKDMPFDKHKLAGNIPVHMYIGGKEHAVLHLYYARFMNNFLYSLGWTPHPEPFKKLLVQGMVMGQSFKLKSSGKYISPDNIEKNGKHYFEKGSGEPLVVQWEKMSKSKHNGENPEKLLRDYGCDTTRLLILADVPPATSRKWSEATFPGVLNWQKRLWMSLGEFLKHRNDNNIRVDSPITNDDFKELEKKIWQSRNYFIATTTYHFKYTQKISVGLSRLQGLTNVLRNKIPSEVIANSKQFEIALATLIIMLSPVAPHFCSELWAGMQSAPRISSDTSVLDWSKSVLEQNWPVVDDDFALSFLCKVDGADRCDLNVESRELTKMTEQQAIEMMLKEKEVQKRISNGILKTKYELYPGCRAILYITTNRKVAKKQESMIN